MTDWKQVRLDTDRNLPLYSQISDKIRTLIHTGELRKGERIPPTSELQEVFRVSAITVENGINALVEEGILLRRRRLGTFVAEEQEAPPKPQQAAHCINVVFNTNRPGGHSYLELLCEMERVCKADGYTIRFTITHPDHPESVAYLTDRCDGIILMGTPRAELIFKLLNAIPLVLIGDPENSTPHLLKNLDYLVNDDQERTFLCIKHLVELGHRRLMAIITPAGTPFERNQKAGLEKARKEFHLSDEEFHILPVKDYLPEFGYKAAYSTLCTSPRPTACMTTESDLAVGIIKAAHDLGLAVPEDLSLITLGNQFNCMRKEPQLTCFESNIPQTVQVAWEKLKKQIHDPNCQKSKTVLKINRFFFGTSTMYYKGDKK